MSRLIENEIKELRGKVLDMAELVLLQLDNVTIAISTRDYKLAMKVRRNEQFIDNYDTNIDERCESILALHQPVANDLRFVFSVLKINAYLEQIGDIINGIARKMFDIRLEFSPELLERLQLARMMELTRGILTQSLMAFFKEQIEQARDVFERDDAIDEIHRSAFDIIVERIQEHPEKAGEYMQLHLIIKSLEKIADFAVCIAEEGLFHLEGKVYKHSALKFAYKNNDGAAQTA